MHKNRSTNFQIHPQVLRKRLALVPSKQFDYTGSFENRNKELENSKNSLCQISSYFSISYTHVCTISGKYVNVYSSSSMNLSPLIMIIVSNGYLGKRIKPDFSHRFCYHVFTLFTQAFTCKTGFAIHVVYFSYVLQSITTLSTVKDE